MKLPALFLGLLARWICRKENVVAFEKWADFAQMGVIAGFAVSAAANAEEAAFPIDQRTARAAQFGFIFHFPEFGRFSLLRELLSIQDHFGARDRALNWQ